MTSLVIDCHGHFTSEPSEFRAYRDAQVACLTDGGAARPVPPVIGDDDLRRVIEDNQLRLQKERGADMTLLSPRASAMGHHLGDHETAIEWAQVSNDIVGRICRLFPLNFAAVSQLPQTVDGGLGPVVDELERCAAAGFVAANVNPDPSGGSWSAPPLHDPWWDPLWEALTALGMPAMVHVSGSCREAVHTTGAHYLNGDTTVFMQLIQGDLFQRHPRLRLIIPHGGGAAPYHWGRFRGLSMMLGKPPLTEHLMDNVFFDTCVYHKAGIQTLFSVVDSRNILFGSELLGAVRATDPETGHAFDDTLRYVDALGLSPDTRRAVLSGNARHVYPRLDALLLAQGR